MTLGGEVRVRVEKVDGVTPEVLARWRRDFRRTGSDDEIRAEILSTLSDVEPLRVLYAASHVRPHAAPEIVLRVDRDSNGVRVLRKMSAFRPRDMGSLAPPLSIAEEPLLVEPEAIEGWGEATDPEGEAPAEDLEQALRAAAREVRLIETKSGDRVRYYQPISAPNARFAVSRGAWGFVILNVFGDPLATGPKTAPRFLLDPNRERKSIPPEPPSYVPPPPLGGEGRWSVSQHSVVRWEERFEPECREDPRDRIERLMRSAIDCGVRNRDPSARIWRTTEFPYADFVVRTDPDGTRCVVTILPGLTSTRKKFPARFLDGLREGEE